ncbi:MAG: ABC transporter ATP-binding protein [Bacteroidales bacterium]|nr:ABC transporter ATP-binding protein [Bacteroidales bacterium]
MIRLDNLHKSYGSRKVLNGVSATIAEGEFCAVMGANGCGKTTLLRCIANLLPPDSGTVLLRDEPAASYGVRRMAQTVAFVRQHAQTDFEFSAFETVLMGRNPYQRRLQNESQRDWDIVEQAMRLTNTWHLRFSKPSQLSGGELQRVMLARALAQQTPLMLLDEPISNLDIKHQFEILNLLQHINEEQHTTILLVIHDLDMALQYCPQLLLLHEGKTLFHGPTAEGLTPSLINKVFGVNATLIGGHLHLECSDME